MDIILLHGSTIQIAIDCSTRFTNGDWWAVFTPRGLGSPMCCGHTLSHGQTIADLRAKWESNHFQFGGCLFLPYKVCMWRWAIQITPFLQPVHQSLCSTTCHYVAHQYIANSLGSPNIYRAAGETHWYGSGIVHGHQWGGEWWFPQRCVQDAAGSVCALILSYVTNPLYSLIIFVNNSLQDELTEALISGEQESLIDVQSAERRDYRRTAQNIISDYKAWSFRLIVSTSNLDPTTLDKKQCYSDSTQPATIGGDMGCRRTSWEFRRCRHCCQTNCTSPKCSLFGNLKLCLTRGKRLILDKQAVDAVANLAVDPECECSYFLLVVYSCCWYSY